MRIIFMGTPEFAVPSLNKLLQNNYTIAAVVTVPDAPSGRGQKLTGSAVKGAALAHSLPLLQPESLKESGVLEHLRSLDADVFVVVAFRILPKEMFLIPRLGSFNLHASILPRYRGAAPIQWAVINGETETGVSTFFLQEKVDTGNILLQRTTPIGDDESAGEVHDRLALLGAEVVLETVRLIEAGKAVPRPQDNSLASPAPKIFKEQCRIDWNKPSRTVHNLIRGLSPRPGAWTLHNSNLLKMYKARPLDGGRPAGQPGTVLEADQRLCVGTGDGVIEITDLQQEGKKTLTAAAFLRGYPLKRGDRL
jgi:methionyl-tRNA formyltransferase